MKNAGTSTQLTPRANLPAQLKPRRQREQVLLYSTLQPERIVSALQPGETDPRIDEGVSIRPRITAIYPSHSNPHAARLGFGLEVGREAERFLCRRKVSVQKYRWLGCALFKGIAIGRV